MKQLTAFFKQLPLRQILTAFLATVVLFVGTACNNGDIRGARPNNLPVQMGGSNNPYKSGGDTNTNYNLSPDPEVTNEASKAKDSRADLPITSNLLIAKNDETLYPGSKTVAERKETEKSLPKKTLQDFEKSEPGGQIQRESDAGERLSDRLGAVKGAFDQASEFIRDDAAEALERHQESPTPYSR